MLSVSVVIPTYNGAAVIAEALASVFAQTVPPREIIVVDDCSTDDTPTIVKHIASDSPLPIRLIRLQDNSGGPAKPINVGIAAAQSELIAVLDQDDVFVHDKLEQEASVLSRHPNLALVAGAHSLVPAPNQLTPSQSNFRRLVGGTDSVTPTILPGSQMLRQLILEENFLHGYPAFMFRKAHWEAKGGVDESLPVASDYDLLCWLCSQGDVALMSAVHYVHRYHDTNISNDARKVLVDLVRIRERYLNSHSWLLRDETVTCPLREWFAGFGYWTREYGDYRTALKCYRLAATMGGWDRALLKAVVKLPIHWLGCQLGIREVIKMKPNAINQSYADT
jgi:glycosyltransferase involved in cell wall biosynthesis